MPRQGRGGDAAFAELVRREGPEAQRLAFRITGDFHGAQDVAQAVFAKVFAQWHKIGRLENPELYVRRMVTHAAIDWYRDRRRRRSLEWLSDRPPELSHMDQPEDDLAALDDVLAVLSPQQRAVVLLRFGEDRTEKDTADLLGIGVGSVKTHTHRAIKRLRQEFADAREETGHGSR